MQNKNKILFLKILLLILTIILALLLYYKFTNINVEFILNGADEITLEVGNKYKDPGFIAKLNNKNVKDRVAIKSDLDENKIGTYTIKYILKIAFLNINNTIERKINVIDNIEPILTINSESEIKINMYEEFTMPTYEAYDNVDGIITDKIKVESNLDTSREGTYNIVYTVSDSSNNIASKTITIYVEPKYKNSYIDISISNQKLNYYEKGKLILTSDIVTGINNGTPTGNYRVLNKARNINLKGADYVSYVNYWIAFIGSSYGMHDASWRSSFGGNIYKYNGSHGCVNMPYNKVKELYNLVQIGTPVYVKY